MNGNLPILLGAITGPFAKFLYKILGILSESILWHSSLFQGNPNSKAMARVT